MCLGCLYGPYLYLVLPLGGLYLAADVLLLYTIFGSGLKTLNNDSESQEGKYTIISVPCSVVPSKIVLSSYNPKFICPRSIVPTSIVPTS